MEKEDGGELLKKEISSVVTWNWEWNIWQFNKIAFFPFSFFIH